MELKKIFVESNAERPEVTSVIFVGGIEEHPRQSLSGQYFCRGQCKKVRTSHVHGQ